MNLWAICHLIGSATGGAAVGTAIAGALASAAGLRPTAPVLSSAFGILFFVVLTQIPLPDPDALACPNPAAEPNLVPLATLRVVFDQWGAPGGLPHFLRRGLALSLAANLVLPAGIGALMARHRLHPGGAVALGLGLSLAVEATQATGLWGLYPCAYRRFDVDDLLFNTLGTGLGFAFARWAGCGRRSGGPESAPAPLAPPPRARGG